MLYDRHFDLQPFWSWTKNEAFSSNRVKRDKIREIILGRRARNPRIFGSVARGEDTHEIDLDLLVDPTPETTLFDLGGLQIDLEELLEQYGVFPAPLARTSQGQCSCP